MTKRTPVSAMSIADVRVEAKQLTRLSSTRAFTDEDQNRWEQLIERLEGHTDQLDRVSSILGGANGRIEFGTPGDGHDSGTARAYQGDPWSQSIDRRTASRADLRSMALTAIERCDGGMSDQARQYATTQLENAAPDPESRMERYVLEASDPSYLRAFTQWMQDPEHGHLGWSDEQRDARNRVKAMERAMSLTTTAGGFLVPYALDPQIIIASAGYADPMRQVARVELTAQNDSRFVTSLGVTSSWDAEAAEVSDDSPVLIQPSVKAFKGQTFTPVSVEIFEDSANLAAQIGTLFADSKASLESSAFTTGGGTTLPTGIITALVAAGGSVVIATASNVLATADLYTNQAALPYRWQQNASWMGALPILNGYRQLPQASGLNFSIVNDSTNPPTVLGRPWYVNGGMDATLTGSAADYSLLNGDFSQYVIVDRVGTSIEFVPTLFGAAGRPTGQRGFLQHWRTGGDCLVPDAFRLSNFST